MYRCAVQTLNSQQILCSLQYCRKQPFVIALFKLVTLPPAAGMTVVMPTVLPADDECWCCISSVVSSGCCRKPYLVEKDLLTTMANLTQHLKAAELSSPSRRAP